MFLPMSCTSPLTVASSDLPLRRTNTAGLVLHEGLEIRDGALHHARRLDDLREEHATGSEEVADDAHSVHQRPLDHVQRPRRFLPRLFRVVLDEVDDPVHEGVLQTLADRLLAPAEIELPPCAGAAHTLGKLDEALGRVGPPIEDHVLDMFEQLGREILVDGELARVDDAHVEAGPDRVEQERRVHRLPHRVVAAEREAQVGDAAGGASAGAAFLDARQAVDERTCVVVVLLHAGRHRQHIRVEDDVLRREADVVHEEVVCPAADRDASLDVRRLALFVEGHDDHARAVVAHTSSLAEELRLALLQGDRVDDPLPGRHCSPASNTVHFELSTITGRRATSGSVAITFRKVRIASSPSSRSASMFTSRRLAPPWTCSSATSTAAP